MSIDGLSLVPLVAELKGQLTGGRIDKIFQPDKSTLVIWVRQPGETVKLIISAEANHPRIHLTHDVPDNPAAPPVFCMLLRKHLEDGRIGDIRQLETDRIVIIDFDVRVEQGLIATKQLIVELMGKYSNIIFTYQDTIIDSIRRVNAYMSRHRQILPGKLYVPPPEQERLNLFSHSAAEIIEQASASSGQLTKALIGTVSGMGPVTAREIVWRAGLPADFFVDCLDAADKASLVQSLSEIRETFFLEKMEPTVAIGSAGQLAGIAAFSLTHLVQAEKRSFPTMSEALCFADSLQGVRQLPLVQELVKLVHTELGRLERKKSLLTAELEEARESQLVRRYADTLMIYLHSIPTGADTAELPDLFSELEGMTLTIPLDPLLSPLANAQKYYTKYNKLERRQAQTAAQLSDCTAEIAYLESVAVALDNLLTNEEAEEIKSELIAAGYMKQKTKLRKPATLPSKPWKTVVNGVTILAGKNNRQNDWLTFKESRPEDIWLHAKDIPGSHVVIRCGESTPDDTVLATAAHLAAWLSKARSSSQVPVDFTRRRYVRKPSGAKPGFVIYEKQQTIYITPDEASIKKLLQI